MAVGCDEVDENDRLIYVKPQAVGRNVLIEDFTGQRCVNCPNATEEIARLQQQYGADTVIAVGIHSGPFSKSVRGVPYDLYTADGDEYFNYWKVESQPKGVIDRKGTSDYISWATIVREELAKTSPLQLKASANYNPVSRSVAVDVSALGLEGTSTGRLQVWLTEDGIQAFQYMPDGTTNREYIHNHVLRCAVNGTWGTEFSVREAETVESHFECSLDEKWVPENMDAVVFVYNDSGVLQVTKCHIFIGGNE